MDFPVLAYKMKADVESKVGEIDIYGVIGEETCSFFGCTIKNSAEQFRKEFKELEKNHDRINVMINSPGGMVHEGKPIVNMIKQSKKEIHTYNDGMAFSMAAFIFFAPPKENRHLAINSLMMLHNVMTIGIGTSKDMKDAAERLEKQDKSLLDDLCESSAISIDELRERFFSYTHEGKNYITAEEALDLGLAESIEGYEADIPDDAVNMEPEKLIQYYYEKQRATEDKENQTDKKGFLHKIAALAGIKGNDNNNLNDMKDLLNINSWLGVESLKADKEENIILTKAQAEMLNEKIGLKQQAIDAAVKADEETNKKIKEAEKKAATAETEKTALQAEHDKLKAEFEAFKAGAGTEGTTAKVKGKEAQPGDKGKTGFYDPNAEHNRTAAELENKNK